MKLGKVSSLIFPIILGIILCYSIWFEGAIYLALYGPINIYEGEEYLVGNRLDNFQSGVSLQKIMYDTEGLSNEDIISLQVFDFSASWFTADFRTYYPTTAIVEYKLNADNFEILRFALDHGGYSEYDMAQYAEGPKNAFGDFRIYYRYENKNLQTIVAVNPFDQRVVLSCLEYHLTDPKSDDSEFSNNSVYYVSFKDLKERLFDAASMEYNLYVLQWLTGIAFYNPGTGIWRTDSQEMRMQ